MALSYRCATRLLNSRLLRFECRKRISTGQGYISSPESTALLKFDTDTTGTIATISLNSASNRNALSTPLLLELNNLLTKMALTASLDNSHKHRVLIIRSNVPKVFSAGHDLKELQKGSNIDVIFRLCSELMCRIRSLPMAVIAEVDGVATAAGCQLVASCDMAIASSNATFATPGVSIGLFCSTPAVALSRAVSSHKHAMEMLLTGDSFDAMHAMRIGLVNRVVMPDDLQREVASVSSKIASKSAEAIRLGKKAYLQQIEESDVAKAYQIATAAMVENMGLDDAKEGIGAFLEKRPPKF